MNPVLCTHVSEVSCSAVSLLHLLLPEAATLPHPTFFHSLPPCCVPRSYSGVGPNNVNPWQEIDMGWTGFTVVNGSVVNNATLITDTYVNGPLIQGPAVSLGSWSDMLSFRA